MKLYDERYTCKNGNMPLSDRMNNFFIQRYSKDSYPRESDAEIQKKQFMVLPRMWYSIEN